MKLSFAAEIGRQIVEGPKRILTQEESVVLLRCLELCQIEPAKQMVVYKEIRDQDMLLKIMDARMQAIFAEGLEFSPMLLVFLAMISGSPGNAVMQVAVMKYMQESGKALHLKALIEDFYAEGIPTNDNYSAAWAAQKAKDGDKAAFTGNLLDLGTSWK